MIEPTNATIIGVNGVSFRYPDDSRGLADCSIAIERGSRTAILGKNGAGKTTLFLHLNGILRPQSGTVIYDGQPLDYSRGGLRRLRSRVGLVFQNPDSQLFSASVREDVSFGPMNLGLDKQDVRQRVDEALANVGMSDYADKPVHSLSFGQKKRVCIAGVLAMEPEIIILDEPMAGLDLPMQQELQQTLDHLHNDGVTLIIATHDMDFAWQWADRISVMVEGKCDATWGTNDLPKDLERLASCGLGTPKVLVLYRALLKTGVVSPSGKVPRSLEDIADIITDSKSTGSNQGKGASPS